MADIELVIKISEDDYNDIMTDKNLSPRSLNSLEKIIANGTPLPKNHGRLLLVDANHLKLQQVIFSTGSSSWFNEAAICKATVSVIEADTESESKRYMELAKSYVQGLRAGLAESEDK